MYIWIHIYPKWMNTVLSGIRTFTYRILFAMFRAATTQCHGESGCFVLALTIDIIHYCTDRHMYCSAMACMKCNIIDAESASIQHLHTPKCAARKLHWMHRCKKMWLRITAAPVTLKKCTTLSYSKSVFMCANGPVLAIYITCVKAHTIYNVTMDFQYTIHAARVVAPTANVAQGREIYTIERRSQQSGRCTEEPVLRSFFALPIHSTKPCHTEWLRLY